MSITNSFLTIIFVNVIFSFSYVFASSNLDNDGNKKINIDIVNYIKKNIAISTINFSEKIKTCESKRDRLISLDTGYLKSINVSKNQVILGFVYLDYQNTFKCQKEAQLKFAYDIGMLVSVQRFYKLDYQESLDIASGLIYPSVEDKLEYIIKYPALPVKLRDYLEKTIGDEPFDFVGSIGLIALPLQ